MSACPPTYRGSPTHVFGLDGVFNALHLLLVATFFAGRVLFGLLQRRLQGLDPLGGRPQSLLHLRDLAVKVGVVPQQLQRGERAMALGVEQGRGVCVPPHFFFTCL